MVDEAISLRRKRPCGGCSTTNLSTRFVYVVWECTFPTSYLSKTIITQINITLFHDIFAKLTHEVSYRQVYMEERVFFTAGELSSKIQIYLMLMPTFWHISRVHNMPLSNGDVYLTCWTHLLSKDNIYIIVY